MKRRPSSQNKLLVIVERLEKEIRELRLERIADKKTIAEQALRIASLEAELAQKGVSKNSGNSHKSPSSDIATPKRNQSLRGKSEKASGGQPGHTGHTLRMKEQPDNIIRHPAPCTCSKCGNDLSGLSELLIEKRQVVDIAPPPPPVYTEHQVFGIRCSCGHVTKGSFPDDVNAPVVYGGNVTAMVAYLHARQYIPYERMAEFFYYMMGLAVSEGSIANLLQRFAQKAQPQYAAIRDSIEQATCLGSDETGAKVNGKKHWYWTWQNESLTYIVHSASRGYVTIEENFPNGFANAILVTDRLAAQLKSVAKAHQICLAHLQRDLKYEEEVYKSQWAKCFKALIKEADALCRQLTPEQFACSNQRRNQLENRLKKLLEQPLPVGHIGAIRLQKQLNKIPGCILRFLHHAGVPSHNNGSEKAIRNVKVKQKVSGQFKSDAGADAFAVIRSIIDTAIKAGKEVFEELSCIANATPAPA